MRSKLKTKDVATPSPSRMGVTPESSLSCPRDFSPLTGNSMVAIGRRGFNGTIDPSMLQKKSKQNEYGPRKPNTSQYPIIAFLSRWLSKSIKWRFGPLSHSLALSLSPVRAGPGAEPRRSFT